MASTVVNGFISNLAIEVFAEMCCIFNLNDFLLCMRVYFAFLCTKINFGLKGLYRIYRLYLYFQGND